MLSIKDFSEMCRLSPQTLRFYHAEGLLVPAEVDEQTGYRGYDFAQLETAMTVMALRGTGMSVKLVRRALDEPDAAAGLLEEHVGELLLKRAAEDDAVATARELLVARPEVRRSAVPGATVLTALAPDPSGPAAGPEDDVWGPTMAAVTATADELTALARARGARVAGPAWASMARETARERERFRSEQGPLWRVALPVDGLPAGPVDASAEVRDFEPREEVSVFLPGALSMAKYGTALSLLVSHPVDGMFGDLASPRLILRGTGVETALRLLDVSDFPDDDDDDADDGNGDGEAVPA
ncbi:MerR family transcriptional regulator [Nocardiopsis flavescens]|uniref:DNA-binding transcriptional regulator, MerR family n=1 Tax=Nocardiopsis flavescens TaxID=758803 RepID=A0A1M6U5N1_9ACTN|nr:MerR family transcriptional regulator [Nocardiopsis flavescens]SHK64480.1 DNA-binding transcriptional regulator, MerR family [Nocardiopsis flavescens]